MSERPTGLLFLCVANSARSQMAEAIARSLVPDGVEVFSAGSAPATVNPFAVRALAERGLEAHGQSSKSVDAVPRERVGTVITLCAEEVCPAWLGDATRLHWPLPDPAAVEGSDEEILASFRAVAAELHSRIADHLQG
jgi:arsenate reductase